MTNSGLASTEEIDKMVLEIVGDHLGRPAPTLSLDDDIVQDLGCGSLDKMELMMTVEELFSIEIPDEVTATIRTIGDIANVIARAGLGANHIDNARKTWKIASRGEYA